jgi:hypothetical protein
MAELTKYGNSLIVKGLKSTSQLGDLMEIHSLLHFRLGI